MGDGRGGHRSVSAENTTGWELTNKGWSGRKMRKGEQRDDGNLETGAQ